MSNLFNVDYLQHLCAKYGLRPSKQYGQNYLIDETAIEKIISAAELSKDDTVVEVGPGFGVLTLVLAQKAGKVVAFEIEKKLQPYWKDSQNKNIEIVWGNVLREVESRKSIKSIKFKVVSNLPYQITSPVLRMFLELERKPTLMVLMVQKEVAERICAKPGDMSVLSVSVQYYAEPEIVDIVPRASFWPAPKVDSAIIKLRVKRDISLALSSAEERESEPSPSQRRGQGEVSPDQQFFHIVKIGFANRRKFLIKNLEQVVGKKNKEQLQKIFSELHLDPKVRAQELSVEQWKELVQKIINISPLH